MKSLLLTLMLLISVTAFGQDYAEWDKYSCDIYQINDDQNPSIWVASVLKEANIDVGKYQIELQKVKDGFYRIKGTKLYIELNDYVPYQSEYVGILDIDAIVVQSPYDNSYSCVGTTEYFYLAPSR